MIVDLGRPVQFFVGLVVLLFRKSFWVAHLHKHNKSTHKHIQIRRIQRMSKKKKKTDPNEDM